MTEIKPGAGRLSSPARVTLLAGLIAAPALLAFNLIQIAFGISAPGNLLAITLFDYVPLALALPLTYWYVARREAAREAAEAAREGALLERLDAIVDSAMDAIITVDEAQKVVLFNRAAEQVFRVRRDQALGEPLERFLPQRFRAAHRGHIEHFGKTGVTSRRMGDVTTLWALRADGEEFPIEASISQAGEPGQRYFTVILRDITLRKQNEDALKRQQQELRELSARVLEAREDEKTRIARELHDELGQLL
ncbi:MAG TPA: PAS domain S-box protein, partial [Burkholderiales bacterium]|nr:PAS domain S-box protein [Burkholderiales bacterium]